MISDYLPDLSRARNEAKIISDYEKQIKVLQTKASSLEKENVHLGFINKQSGAQCRKLERDLLAQNKTLRELQHCGACRCLAQSRKRSGSRSRPYLAQVQDVATNCTRASSVRATSQTVNGQSLTPADTVNTVSGPSTGSDRVENLTEELRLLRRANVELRELTQRLEADLQTKESQIESLRSPGNDNLGVLLSQRNAEITQLHKQVSDLVAQNARLSQGAGLRSSTEQAISEVQQKVTQIEAELLSVRNERQQLLAEVENYRKSENSRETNLLRCERQLKQAMKDKQELKMELEILRSRARTLEAEAERLANKRESLLQPGQMRRSTSETLLTKRPRSPTRKSVNPYCPVCRNFRSQLETTAPGVPRIRGGVTFPNSVKNPAETMSGGGSSHNEREVGPNVITENRRLIDQVRKLEMEKRLLEHEKESLSKLYESSNQEAAKLRREVWLKTPEFESNIPSSSANGHSSKLVEKLRSENEKLRKQIQVLKDHSEDDKARYHANESLLKAQKTKTEQDYDSVRSKMNSLNSTVERLQHELDDKELNLRALQAQLASETGHFAGTSQAIHNADVKIRECQSTIANLEMKCETAQAARITAESKLADSKRQLEKSEAEAASLRNEIRALRLDLESWMNNSDQTNKAELTQLRLQLKDKDREVSRLKNTVKELDDEYKRFQMSLLDQEQNLSRLQRDLSLELSLKAEAEKVGKTLLDQNNRLQENALKFEQNNAMLRLELHQSIEEQNSLQAKIQKYLDDIESFETLVAEKERERSALLAQLQDISMEPRPS